MYVTKGDDMASTATERREVRLTPEADDQLREAAELERKSVSKFLLDAGLDRAQEVIAAHRTWSVSEAFFNELLSALDAPPVINEALAKARAEADLLIERR